VTVGDMVINVDSVVDSHGPQGGVGNIGPPDSSMEHHGASHGHDGLNTALSDAVVVVRADASEASDLFENRKFLGKGSGAKGASIVAAIGLDDNAGVASRFFEAMFRLESFVGSHGDLRFVVDEPRGVVNEQGAAAVHAFFASVALGGVEATGCTTNVVIDGDLLTGKEVLAFECAIVRDIERGGRAWGWSTFALAELTGSAARQFTFGGSFVERTLTDTSGKSARCKQETDDCEVEVTEAEVPA
jgi:hypothetical protein